MTRARSIANCLFRTLLPAALLAVVACASPAPEESAPSDAPALVLVSIDGFRWDFDRFAETPTLDRMARSGLKARALQPAYPTLTFPNHYSIATGLLPQHHGIVANSFPDATRKRWYRMSDRAAVQDGRWYAGEPVWVTAEKQGLRSAAYYFVGTEADIDVGFADGSNATVSFDVDIDPWVYGISIGYKF